MAIYRPFGTTHFAPFGQRHERAQLKVNEGGLQRVVGGAAVGGATVRSGREDRQSPSLRSLTGSTIFFQAAAQSNNRFLEVSNIFCFFEDPASLWLSVCYGCDF